QLAVQIHAKAACAVLPCRGDHHPSITGAEVDNVITGSHFRDLQHALDHVDRRLDVGRVAPVLRQWAPGGEATDQQRPRDETISHQLNAPPRDRAVWAGAPVPELVGLGPRTAFHSDRAWMRGPDIATVPLMDPPAILPLYSCFTGEPLISAVKWNAISAPRRLAPCSVAVRPPTHTEPVITWCF